MTFVKIHCKNLSPFPSVFHSSISSISWHLPLCISWIANSQIFIFWTPTCISLCLRFFLFRGIREIRIEFYLGERKWRILFQFVNWIGFRVWQYFWSYLLLKVQMSTEFLVLNLKSRIIFNKKHFLSKDFSHPSKIK